jgi:hypothetical protein
MSCTPHSVSPPRGATAPGSGRVARGRPRSGAWGDEGGLYGADHKRLRASGRRPTLSVFTASLMAVTSGCARLGSGAGGRLEIPRQPSAHTRTASRERATAAAGGRGEARHVQRDLLELLEPPTFLDDDAPASAEHDVVLGVAAGASIELEVDRSPENLDVEEDILDLVRDRRSAIHKRSARWIAHPNGSARDVSCSLGVPP